MNDRSDGTIRRVFPSSVSSVSSVLSREARPRVVLKTPSRLTRYSAARPAKAQGGHHHETTIQAALVIPLALLVIVVVKARPSSAGLSSCDSGTISGTPPSARLSPGCGDLARISDKFCPIDPGSGIANQGYVAATRAKGPAGRNWRVRLRAGSWPDRSPVPRAGGTYQGRPGASLAERVICAARPVTTNLRPASAAWRLASSRCPPSWSRPRRGVHLARPRCRAGRADFRLAARSGCEHAGRRRAGTPDQLPQR